MYGIDIPGQKKYYKYVEKDFNQYPVVSTSNYSAYPNSVCAWSPESGYGALIKPFAGTGTAGFYKDGGDLNPNINIYVPRPIRVTSVYINASRWGAGRYGGVNLYATDSTSSWEKYTLASFGYINSERTIAVTNDKYFQFFRLRGGYPANNNTYIYSVKIYGKYKPELTETTEEEAEFSIDYSGVKVRYADNKYYGL